MEVSLDRILAQHLVITQPQVAPLFLEQDLDRPTLLVDRHDSSRCKLRFVRRKHHQALPRRTRTLGKNQANVTGSRQASTVDHLAAMRLDSSQKAMNFGVQQPCRFPIGPRQEDAVGRAVRVAKVMRTFTTLSPRVENATELALSACFALDSLCFAVERQSLEELACVVALQSKV